jgi:Yip1 domain
LIKPKQTEKEPKRRSFMTVSNEQPQRIYRLTEPARSFGKQLWQLPGQYWRVLTRPSPETFIAETAHPSWGIVWLQLCTMALFAGSMAVISGEVISPTLLPAQISELSNFVDFQTLQNFLNISTAVQIGLNFLLNFLVQILGFFLLMGILHFSAVKLMGKSGSFLSLCYAVLLATVPLMFIGLTFGAIPYLGVLSVIGSLYMLVLQLMAVQATYRLSVGRTIGVASLSLAILIALIVVVAVILSAVIVLGLIRVL